MKYNLWLADYHYIKFWHLRMDELLIDILILFLNYFFTSNSMLCS